MKLLFHFIINVFLAVFLFVFPRKKTIVICTGWGGDRFADNSRWMYLYLNENIDKLGSKKNYLVS